MKRFIKFLIKAVTCMWVGAFIPMIVALAMYINSNMISRCAAALNVAIWLAGMMILGALWGDKE